jgi:hypothetical protein
VHPGKSPSLRLTISYDGWKGDFADGPEGFRNKDFVLKETSFKEFGKGDKMAPGTDVKVPQELEHLVVNSQLVKDKDIGWDGHEKWAIIMTLVDSKKAAQEFEARISSKRSEPGFMAQIPYQRYSCEFFHPVQ